jgi:hypothetical protein
MRSLSFVAAGAIAPTAHALDAAGFTLGRELTMQDRAEMTRGGNGTCIRNTCRGTRQLGDFSATVTLTADEGGIIRAVFIRVPEKNGRALLDAAVAKYGKPAKAQAGTVQNTFAAQFNQTGAIWKLRDGSVTFLERCGKVNESCLLAADPAYASAGGGKLKL